MSTMRVVRQTLPVGAGMAVAGLSKELKRAQARLSFIAHA